MIDEIQVSPHFRFRPTDPDRVRETPTGKEWSLHDVDTKIAIFQDRVLGWFVNIGNLLIHNDDASYILLMIAVSQVEGLQQYYEGESSNNRSPESFKNGMLRLFALDNTATSAIRKFYTEVRCGLFHDGFTNGAVFLSEAFLDPLLFDEANQLLKINPHRFAKKVEQDIKDYCAKLRAKSDQLLLDRFIERWDSRWRSAKSARNEGYFP
jgi:hypothetical protein